MLLILLLHAIISGFSAWMFPLPYYIHPLHYQTTLYPIPYLPSHAAYTLYYSHSYIMMVWYTTIISHKVESVSELEYGIDYCPHVVVQDVMVTGDKIVQRDIEMKAKHYMETWLQSSMRCLQRQHNTTQQKDKATQYNSPKAVVPQVGLEPRPSTF